ncbi:hypothetical protein LSAT2_002941 [Lamellibrachia satsuma]|nr:hypothetical protein LSAT2_002941 [Lamellibrachia satsuma]
MSQTPIKQREQSSKGTVMMHQDDPTNEEEEVWGQWSEEEVPGAGSSRSNEGKHRDRRLHPEYLAQLSKEEQHNHRVEQHDTRRPEVPPISLGMPKENLKTSPTNTVVLPPLRTTDDHTVLTTLHTRNEAHSSSTAGGDRGRSARSYQRQGSKTRPMPEDPHLWHPDFVKMPFSKKAECTVKVSGRFHIEIKVCEESNHRQTQPQTYSTTDRLNHRQTQPQTYLTTDILNHRQTQPQTYSTTDILNHRHTQRQTYSTTDRLNHRHTQPQTDSTTDRLNHRHTQPQTYSTTDILNHRQTQPQTYSTTDILNNRHTQPQTDSTTDRLNHKQTQPQTDSTTDRLNDNK